MDKRIKQAKYINDLAGYVAKLMKTHQASTEQNILDQLWMTLRKFMEMITINKRGVNEKYISTI